MSVAVVIPFRSDDPARLGLRDVVLGFYGRHFPDWPVTVSAGTGELFSRGNAINTGVAESDGEVVVVNDADSLVSPDQLARAATWATAAPGLVYAYTRYLRFDSDGALEWEQEDPPSIGAMAIRRDFFDLVGGLEERFAGWGYEDMEFAYRASKLVPSRRVPGDLTHLWHGPRRLDGSPRSEDAGQIARNWWLYRRLTG